MNGSCIIVGASHAGVSLAFQLRREGWEGKITLISEESELPYHRPPLSKEYLAGKKGLDAIQLRPQKLYQDNDIELLLSTRVCEIDRTAKTVSLESGEQLPYDKLALCTGASVREFIPTREMDNVFYIRTAADIAQLAPQIEAGRRAVVIGGGYIGLEAAAVLAESGLAVTVLESSERILRRVTSPEMSLFMQQLHESHGVDVQTGVEIADVQAVDGHIRIDCGGGTEHQADLLIVGIGVDANSGLAMQAGLQVNNGIEVDKYCRSSDDNIFAAGDCTTHPSAIYGRQIRLESVQNANDQGRVAAANICGGEKLYDAVPWFWSDQYNIKLQMVGLSTDYDQLVMRGDARVGAETSFAIFYLKAGVLIAADCVARPKEFMLSKQWVKAGARIDADTLSDENIDLVEFAKAMAAA